MRLVTHTPLGWSVDPETRPTGMVAPTPLGGSALSLSKVARRCPDPTLCSPTGLFGTGIQSYFTFLRFLLLLNLLTLLLTSSFVLLPLVWLRPPDPGPALNFSECLAARTLP